MKNNFKNILHNKNKIKFRKNYIKNVLFSEIIFMKSLYTAVFMTKYIYLKYTKTVDDKNLQYYFSEI